MKTECIFGSVTTSLVGDVIVPRCSLCQHHHADLPGRIEAWHEVALRKGDSRHFSETTEASQAKRAHDSSMRALAQADSNLERAELGLKRAIASQGFLSRVFGRPNAAKDAAIAALNQATHDKTEAVASATAAGERFREAQAALKEVRARAVAAHKSKYPQPDLPEGVRPEGEYSQAPAVIARLGKKWLLGDSPAGADDRINAARGTVSRLPSLKDLD